MTCRLLVLAMLFTCCAAAQELSAPASHVQAPAGSFFRDRAPLEPVCSAHSVIQGLAGFSDEEKANCRIDVSLGPEAGPAAEEAARAAETLWNAGRYADALEAIASLEVSVPRSGLAIGIAYRTSKPSSFAEVEGTDVRIGTKDSVVAVALDIDHTNGNMLAALLTRTSSGNAWLVYFSSDGGKTWLQTYSWMYSAYDVRSISLTIVGGNAYVLFTRGVNQDQILAYRFSTATGASSSYSNGLPYVTTATTSVTESFEEVSACSNDESYANRVYVSAITSTGKLRFFWYIVDSLSANEVNTGVTAASHGLSTAFNVGNAFVWFSYVDTSGAVCIDSLGLPSIYARADRYASARLVTNTSIGAHRDTVMCAFDHVTSFTQTSYLIRYGDENIWRYGAFADTSLGSETPAVTLAGGGGIAVAFRYYTPVRTERLAYRPYPIGSTWSNSTVISGNEPYYNQPAIVSMGNAKYGVLYLSWSSPVTRGAYFGSNQTATTGVTSEPALPAGCALHQNYPNPFNPTTKIGYKVSGLGSRVVRLSVYDLLGREVAVLVDGTKEAGSYEVVFDGARLASGVYVCRITAGEYVASRRMILLR